MLIRKEKSALWLPLLTLFVIVACLPAFGTPQQAPIQNETNSSATVSFGQAIIEIRTFTPTIGPSVTPSPTVTETPFVRDTLTPIPPTPTVFILSTATSMISSTLSPSGYACEVVSVTPIYKTVFKPGTNFDAKWIVINTGRKKWDGDHVDYVYAGGDVLHVKDAYDLQKSLLVGRTREIVVDMEAPLTNGIYTTNWIFQAGEERFCPLSLTIMVQK
jgi:hypothetical protein